MAFERVVSRKLPDGTVQKVYPFHISLEGMESVLLCRDDEDYDHLEKSFYVSAWVNNCLVIIEITMSNHGHAGVLATDLESAIRLGEYAKKRHSQYLSWKYHETAVLARAHVDVQYLDTDWYVRNALAYIPATPRMPVAGLKTTAGPVTGECLPGERVPRRAEVLSACPAGNGRPCSAHIWT